MRKRRPLEAIGVFAHVREDDLLVDFLLLVKRLVSRNILEKRHRFAFPFFPAAPGLLASRVMDRTAAGHPLMTSRSGFDHIADKAERH